MAPPRGSRGGRGGEGGKDSRPGFKSGSKRAAGGGAGEAREVQISKALSFLLRHGAERERVAISAAGWVRVSDALAWRRLRGAGATFAEVCDCVATNEKQRFQLAPARTMLGSQGGGSVGGGEGEGKIESTPADEAVGTADGGNDAGSASTSAGPASGAPDALLVLDPDGPDDPAKHVIRATQGHSLTGVAAAEVLSPVTAADIPGRVPALAVHGTTAAAWPRIRASGGLKRMTRQHVHLATAAGAGEVVSGMRKSSDVLVWVDVARALRDGVKFWLSANGVVLTDGFDGMLPLKYFDRVESRDRKGGPIQVIWKPEDAAVGEAEG